jgi:carboxyl-terminal processing protease
MTLTRAAFTPSPLIAKIVPTEVAYIRPETLSSARVSEIAAALRDLQTKGAKKLVLDLRQCAVGEPEDGIALADLFLDKGLVTYLQGQRWARKDFQADPSKVIWKLPVVVLTNRGTADAAEITAAALQDGRRAQVVGERTYGDASLRQAITMDDGSAIILSVAKYYSPNGKSIQDTGVTPNEVIQEPQPQIETDEDNDTPRQDVTEPERKTADDVVLKRAIEILNK